MYVYAWLIIFVLAVIMEAATAGLTTIWFAGGAFVAFILALIGVDLGWQIAAFIAVSILLLIFTRPLVRKFINKRTVQTNVLDSVIGRSAVVSEEINNIQATGKITLDGMPWTARSEEEDTVIPAGTEVTVVKVVGVKCIVKP